MPTAVADPEACSECGHTTHAGRCFRIVPVGEAFTYCPCKYRRQVDTEQPFGGARLGSDSWRA
jgi:hypothetical protein